MLIGFSIYTLSYFLYLFAKIPLHIYIIQLLMGIGGAFAFTPWYGFFSRHIDRYHENFEWSLEVSLVGFGTAAAGFAAGIIAERFGFAPLFLCRYL
jgi:MFS family permease